MQVSCTKKCLQSLLLCFGRTEWDHPAIKLRHTLNDLFLNADCFLLRHIWCLGKSESTHGPWHAGHIAYEKIVKLSTIAILSRDVSWESLSVTMTKTLPRKSLPGNAGIAAWKNKQKTQSVSFRRKALLSSSAHLAIGVMPSYAAEESAIVFFLAEQSMQHLTTSEILFVNHQQWVTMRFCIGQIVRIFSFVKHKLLQMLVENKAKHCHHQPPQKHFHIPAVEFACLWLTISW